MSNIRNIPIGELRDICQNSSSYVEVMRKIGYKKLCGNINKYVRDYIESVGIDNSNLISKYGENTLDGLTKNEDIICGIYMITNNVNAKIYIGQSVNIKKRLIQHRETNGSNGTSIIHQEIVKYGAENFSYSVLRKCSKEELDYFESYYIEKYNSTNEDIGYNVNTGGNFVKMTNTMLNSIIYDLQNTLDNSEKIGKRYEVSGRTIRSINTGEFCKIDGINYPIRKELYRIHKERRIEKKTHPCLICGRMTINDKYCCQECTHIAQYRTRKPSRDELKSLIRKYNFIELGDVFNVNDNSVRKWCKLYGLPFRSHEIKLYTDEEWDNEIPFEKVKERIELEKLNKKVKPSGIQKIDISTGEIIEIYKRVIEAARSVGTENSTHITEVCEGRRKTAFGFFWKYIY